VLVAAGAAAAAVRPWHRWHSDGEGDVNVTRATLSPGEITLVVANSTEEAATIAQVILNDAFVDFRAPPRALVPGSTETLRIDYPWIRGESYDIELMTSTGATIGYEIDDAA
jgi:hypothetical protein